MSEDEGKTTTALIRGSSNSLPVKSNPTLTSLIQADKLDELRRLVSSSTGTVMAHEIYGTFLWACNSGYGDAVSVIIQSGIDVNVCDQFGASALHHAIQGCHPHVIIILVDSGAEFLDLKIEDETLLHWASRNGFVDVVRTLLDHEASLTTPDGYGRYPIHSACLHGMSMVIPVLLSTSNTGRGNRGTLRYSVITCSKDQYGPDITDENGWTPLHYACTSSTGNPREVVQELLHANANPLISTPNGKTSIDLAFESGRDYLFLSHLPMTDVLLILAKIDSIRPKKLGLSNKSSDKGFHFEKHAENEDEEQQLGRSNMSRLRRNYSFLHNDFHRLSRRSHASMPSKNLKSIHESFYENRLAKLKDWSLTTVWRNILQNDDTELLELLRDFRVHESETNDDDEDDITFNSFEDAYVLEPRILSEIHMSCFENGLAIFSLIKGEFKQQLEDKNYLDIFLRLTKFNPRAVTADKLDNCTVMWPIHSSMIFIALLCGRLRVVEMLLRMRQFDILPTTFVVILIIRRLAKDSAFSDDVKLSLRDFSDRLEAFAVDIINKVFLRDNSEGKSSSINFINTPMGCLGQATIIDIAARASCETFLSLPCSQVVLYNLWHGQLHWLPYSWKIVTRFFPFILPFYFMSRQTRERRMSTYSRKLRSFDASKPLIQTLHLPGRGCENHRVTNVSSPEDFSQLDFVNKLKMIKHSFTIPSNKFIYHSIFHMIFLVMLSYVLLYDFHFQISIPEGLCYAFLIGYTIEEARQIIFHGIDKKLKRYIKDTWNILDISAITITITGFIIRLPLVSTTASVSTEVENVSLFAARTLLLTGLLVFYMRILIVFSLFSRLGPKLRMMFAMVWFDLLPMLCIFVLFIISFGITFQGILFPNGYDLTKVNGKNEFQRQTPRLIAQNIVRSSFYGMMAAEYNVESLESDNIGGCNSTSSCRTVIVVSRNLILYGYNILYVLIVNIMLVNLLIALYSNTVAHINIKSTSHWLADKYSLAHEFRQRSVCPPPFNIISVIVELIISCCKRRKRKYESKSASCKCKIIRYLVIQGFALRQQRGKIGNTRLQEATELSDRLSGIEKQMSELRSLLQRITTRNPKSKGFIYEKA